MTALFIGLMSGTSLDGVDGVIAAFDGGVTVHAHASVDFDAALHLQQRLADELRDRSDTRGALILCEHPPIVTIGRQCILSQLSPGRSSGIDGVPVPVPEEAS